MVHPHSPLGKGTWKQLYLRLCRHKWFLHGHKEKNPNNPISKETVIGESVIKEIKANK